MKSRVPGRPRSVKSKDAILEAAFALLEQRGYAGFALEQVAAAAGAGKTTIYRWWRSKAALAVDAFFHATQAELRFPDLGAAEKDFRAQITELGALLRGPRGRVFAAMLGAARTDPALGRALGQRWLAPRRKWGFERMMQAAASGELNEGVEPGAALALLYSPLYAPLLFGGEAPSREELDAVLKLSCRAVFREA